MVTAPLLAAPPGEGFGGLLDAAPPVAFVLGGAVLFVLVRRMTGRQTDADSGSFRPPQTSYDERLDEELRELD